jgi:hypothetical protein
VRCETLAERSTRDRGPGSIKLIFINSIIDVSCFRINFIIMKSITTIFILFLAIITLSAQDIIGTWSGDLNVTDQMGQAQKLTVKFNISATDDGYTSTLDSPDQEAYDMAVDTTIFKDSELTIKAAEYQNLVYVGKLADATTMNGTLTQAGMDLELNMKKETE